jgi:hypothetical protein
VFVIVEDYEGFGDLEKDVRSSASALQLLSCSFSSYLLTLVIVRRHDDHITDGRMLLEDSFKLRRRDRSRAPVPGPQLARNLKVASINFWPYLMTSFSLSTM